MEVADMTTLPRDANILFSVLNTKLRDYYGSLDALCDDLQADKADILARMAVAGYHYDAARNRFAR